MKINSVLSIIATALSCLIGYLVYNVAEGQDGDIVCGIASTICFTTTLIPLMGAETESTKLTINIKVMSSIFLIAFLISHFSFAAICIKIAYYIITNGILLLIYAAILYKMQQIKNI